jgi:hypothetical protein
MRIKNYYILSKDGTKTGFAKVSGNLILKNKRVVSPLSELNLKSFPKNALPQKFYYEYGSERFLAKPNDLNGNQIEIQNKIFIIEVDQNGAKNFRLHAEYLIENTWWNRSQLEWMFNKHWFQSNFKFWLPFIISIISVIIAYCSYENSSNSLKENSANKNRLDSLDAKIKLINTQNKPAIYPSKPIVIEDSILKNNTVR